MSNLAATESIWSAPKTTSARLPDHVDVVVVGAGMAGLQIAKQMVKLGMDILVLEKRTQPAMGMATRGLGIASIVLLDPPFRLIQAVGLGVAREITRFTSESVAMLGPRLSPVGVGYLPKGSNESSEVEANLQAMTAMGLSAERWNEHGYPGLGAGWRQPQGGTVEPQSMMQDLTHNVPIATDQEVTDIVDSGFELQVQTNKGVKIRTELVIMSGGAQLTPWAKEKFYPVRHQSLATEATRPLVPCPLHLQYGYTSIRQTVAGQMVVAGCRWASPHLEVGETDDGVINPAIHAKLSAFLRQHIPGTDALKITHCWSSIMTFSCDGLPVIGPLPGRPRIISCGGFGAFGPSLSARAAKAVVDGITTGTSPGVPECFSTQRFE